MGKKVADGNLSLQIEDFHQNCHNYISVWEVLINDENAVIDENLWPNNTFVQWRQNNDVFCSTSLSTCCKE